MAHTLETELKRVAGTRDLYTIGAPDRVVRVLFDPAKLSGYGLSLADLRRSLQATNASADAGYLVGDNREIPVQAGSFLVDPGKSAVWWWGCTRARRCIWPMSPRSNWVRIRRSALRLAGHGSGGDGKGISSQGEFPAVTPGHRQKPGENAVRLPTNCWNASTPQGHLHSRGHQPHRHSKLRRHRQRQGDDPDPQTDLRHQSGHRVGVDRAGLARGLHRRHGGDPDLGDHAVRVLGLGLHPQPSLFVRLDLSIGILVDDAIVVVENIHRHIHLGGRKLVEAIPLAVDEVGGPTILATFTVIAALLPMAFVSGLMGPYMSPIPINSSMGMLISLAVAFVFTPWLTYKVLAVVGARPQPRRHPQARTMQPPARKAEKIFASTVPPRGRSFLRGRRGKPLRWMLGIGVLLLIAGSVSLAYFQLVVLKMLPFDNKSEFQVVVDMPEGTTLEQTAGCWASWAATSARSRKSPTIRSTPAPPHRSISMAWSGSITCVPAPTSAISRSTWSTRNTVIARATTSR